MITIDGLTKRYGATLAVDHATFEVSPGRITGFLGPNGAGKSTTLRLLLGLEKPTAGTALIDEQEYACLREPLKVVGALLDAGWIHPRRSGRNHLRWMAAMNGLPDSRVDECLDLVGLREVSGRRAGAYSLGMRQRLGLAGAMLGDPRYLVFDEPLNGLDPEGIRWMRTLLRRFANEGRGVLVSSHLLSEVAQTVDDIVIIARGRVRPNSSIADYLAGQGQALVRVTSADPAALAAALTAASVGAEVTEQAGDTLTVAGASPRQIGEIAAAHRIAVWEIGKISPSLEDAFLAELSEEVEYRGRN